MHLCVGMITAVLLEFNGVHEPTIQTDYQPEFSSTQSPLIPSVGILLFVIVVMVLMIACWCIRRCCRHRSSASVADIHGAAVGTCGLGREDIDSLPTVCYSEVKSRKIGKGALECAVCLNEFDDGDMITLLPKCDHVFHPECIGAWLEHHVTCPVCRSDLMKAAAEKIEETTENDDIPLQLDEVQISNGDDKSPRSETIEKLKSFNFAKFRSHTTGHSLVLPGENLDRFTLRLPSGVRKEIMKRCMLNQIRISDSGKSGYIHGGTRFNQWFRRSMEPDRRAIFTRTMSLFSSRTATDGSGGGITGFRTGGRATRRINSLKSLERQD